MKKLLSLSAMTVLAGTVALTDADARPVSYPGGWTLMQVNEAESHSLHIHYSPSPKYSIGLKVEDMGYQDHIFYGGQYNRLLKRWNKPASQANIYLKLGAGIADGQFNEGLDKTQAAGFARLSGDWETRRWFTGGDIHVYATEDETMSHQSIRLGVAPYVADTGALHTWLMVQVDHRPNLDETLGAEKLTATPLIRFFKGSGLLELGYSTNEEPLVNFIYRF